MLGTHLTGTDEVEVALLLAAGSVLASLGVWRLIAFNRNEERRRHPIAIVNREVGQNEASRFGVSITNPGLGTAFNVRVGVVLDGIEYPLGPGEGHRYTVGAGERVPPEGMLTFEALPSVDAATVLYARYENAFGETWESFNPVDTEAGLEVRRSRFAALRHVRAWRRRKKRRA